MNVHVYVDGGCRHNGAADAAAYGSYLIRGRKDTRSTCEFPKLRTNNQAEYAALLMALDALNPLIDYPGTKVTVFSDSALVVGQMTLGWRVKEPSLRDLHTQCMMKYMGLRANGVDIEIRQAPRDLIVAKLGH